MFVNYKDQYNPLDGVRSTQIPYRDPVNNVVGRVEDAKRLIDLIMEQGEGSDAQDERAHAHIFVNIYNEYLAEKAKDDTFEPFRNVLQNPMTRILDDVQLSLIEYISLVEESLDNGLPYDLLQLFNSAYETMLCWLFQVFDRRGTPEELKAIESLAFMPMMSEIIRPLMEFLTRVPVILPGHDIEARLGAGFEVSPNNFLVPKPELTFTLSKERLHAMTELAEQILGKIKVSGNIKVRDLWDDFAFITKSFLLLEQEFESRVLFGVKPHSAPDFSFAEGVQNFKPKVITPPMVILREWNLRGPAVLNLEFQGWFQVRLASDPDGANEKRGVTGNSFAVGDEPDFDRIIRFKPEANSARSHNPKIGVTVTRARILHPPTDLNLPGTEVPEFLRAELNLLDNAKFEGRNNLVSGVGEPIDPFTLEIVTNGGIRLTKSVNSSRRIVDMSPAQRAGTGRYVLDPQISVEKMKEILKRIGYESPQAFVKERIELLENELEEKKRSGCDCLDVQLVKLRHRLECLYETRSSANGEAVPGFVRWTRFFFHFNYQHTLSRELSVSLNNVSLPFKFKKEKPHDYRTKWLIDYNMGFFDSDSHCGFIYGSVQIPIEVKS